MNENLDYKFIEMIDTKIIVSNSMQARLIPCDELELKIQDNIMPYLYLSDISKQMEVRFGKDITIDVWVELGLSGFIYRFNSHDRVWVEHGTTNGFA